MVNRLRLNEKSVRDAEPAKGRDYQIFDTDVRGFAVCIYRSGNRAFTIDYRHAGRQRRMTIGRWPEWSTTSARDRAKELRREIDAGADPLGQKETGRDAPRITDMIDRYTEVHLPHLAPTNASDQKSMLAKLVVPEWGNRLVPRGCVLLFPGDVPGQPVKEIRRFWASIQKQVDIPDVRIHDLRHTFASLLVSGGASLEMIGKLLGHSQMQTTQRYAHLMDSPLRAGVDAVASAFRPRPKLVHDADGAQKLA